jgi:NADH-quinone oxidoreductase subunit C
MNSFDLLTPEARERSMSTWEVVLRSLREAQPNTEVVTSWPNEVNVDVLTIRVRLQDWLETLRFLQSEAAGRFVFLSDYTATDEFPVEPRFDLVVHLYSFEKKARIRIKTSVKDGEAAPTLISLWPGANWAEREIFDMFGVVFQGHPDLRRIVMDLRWKGHPLRKDYPITGYQSFTSPEPIDESVLSNS